MLRLLFLSSPSLCTLIYAKPEGTGMLTNTGASGYVKMQGHREFKAFHGETEACHRDQMYLRSNTKPGRARKRAQAY